MERNKAWLKLYIVILIMISSNFIVSLIHYKIHLSEWTTNLIFQFMSLVIPIVIFINLRNKNLPLKKYLRLNKFSPSLLPQLIFLPITANIFFALLGMPFSLLFQKLLGPLPPQIYIDREPLQMIMMFISTILIAPVAEEILFRGIFSREFESGGLVAVLFFAAIGFGMAHFRIHNLFQLIMMGVLFVVCMLKTNSLYASIIMHISNNLFAMITTLALQKLDFASAVIIKPEHMIASLIFISGFIACIICFPVLFLSFYKKTQLLYPDWKNNLIVFSQHNFKIRISVILMILTFIAIVTILPI